MKVFCLNKISKVALNKLKNSDKIVDTIEDADVVLVRSASMHEMIIPDNIIAIARSGAGTNNIPTEELAKRGIVVFNTPGANANSVKELVLCGLLLASREVVKAISWVHENKDNVDLKNLVEKSKSQFLGQEIMNKKIGIIGLGVIGVSVANACYDLGMEVYGFDPFLSINNAMNLNKNINYLLDVNQIYQKCDFISVHIPLTTQTKDFISVESFKEMKEGVIILNFARDGIINEEALANNLNTKKVKKYITDFPNYQLMKNENVIAIPHLGASTDEAENNCASMAIEELQNYYLYGTIRNSVNFPSLDAEAKHDGYRIAINHENKVGMINEFTKLIAKDNGNIIKMVNKSYKEFAYTVLDIDAIDSLQITKEISQIDGVLKVRVI